MTPAKNFEHKLVAEYGRAEQTLINKFSTPLSKQVAKEAIDSTLLVTSALQTELILREIPAEYVAGIYLESDLIAGKIPAYVGFDFGAKRTGINKLTKNTIGHIGKFNEKLANELKLRYGNLVSDNELLTQLDKHGWTAHTENRMVKMGFDKETINLVKHQTTTNKMIHILEQQGIRGNIPPTEVAQQLVPHIKSVFGTEGVTINNIGSVRKVLSVDADGNHKWINKKVTRAFHTTTNNYANIIARSTIVDANRLARHETLQQSGFVKVYRSVAVMDERTGYMDAMMHGVIVKWGGGPPYHARCRCEYAPIWKKSTGLSNRPDSFYNDKRDKYFWKQHQLKKYNATLPKGSKIPNANYLPKHMLKGMPGKVGMRKIRADMLGQPLPVTKPKVPKPAKIVKPVETKPKPTGATSKAQIKEDKKIGKELFDKTKKDSREYGLTVDANGKKYYTKGDKHSIQLARPKDIAHTNYHTHPTMERGVAEGFSGADVNNFLVNKGAMRTVVITEKNMHIMTKTPKTPTLYGGLENRKAFKRRFEDLKKSKMLSFDPSVRSHMSSYTASLQSANKVMAKKYDCRYEIVPRGGG